MSSDGKVIKYQPLVIIEDYFTIISLTYEIENKIRNDRVKNVTYNVTPIQQFNPVKHNIRDLD